MKKIKNFREKGITLVALVITIIILLILAGVTINTALSENGLFRMAKKAGNEYQESEKQEQEAIEEIAKEMEKISIDYNDYVGVYVTGYTPTGKTKENPCIIEKATSGVTSNTDKSDNPIKDVEENLEQKFTTEELGWKIWDYDKNTKTIRLISDKPTETTLTLEGATGYNNGVWAVNEICRQCYGQYDENGQMKRGINVANLRRSDIQKVSTYDYTQYKHEEKSYKESENGTVRFGDSKTYDNSKYPKIWEEVDSKWTLEDDKECLIWERENKYEKEAGEGTGINNPDFKESYYNHNYINKENEFINREYYNLLFNDESSEPMLYWLAGRYVHWESDQCSFGLQVFVSSLNDGLYMSGQALFWSGRKR